MKKLKLILSFVIICAAATFIAVAGFYINENTTAVVDWLNNSIVVTNDDYKNLVIETTTTIEELNGKVKSLEDENVTLTNEKSVLTAEVEELQKDLDVNEDMINSYLKQIDDINIMLEENNQIISELKALINEMSASVIRDILVLPKELAGANLSYNWVGNDCFITMSDPSSAIYFFDFDRGTLSLLSTTYYTIDNIYNKGNLYFFVATRSGSVQYICSYNSSTGEFKELVQNSVLQYVEYGNGLYMFLGRYTYFYDCETQVFERVLDTGYEASSYYSSLNIYENYVIGAFNNSNSYLFYFNLETRDYSLIAKDGLNLRSIPNRCEFRFKGKHYILMSLVDSAGEYVKGLYEIDLEVKKLNLISEIPFTNGTDNSRVNGTIVYEDIVVFQDYKDYYYFDGETVSKGETTISSYAVNPDKEILLYEDDNVRYFTRKCWRDIFKHDRTTGVVSIVATIEDDPIQKYLITDNMIFMFDEKKFYVFDMTTDTLTTLFQVYGSSLSNFSIIDFGDSVYCKGYRIYKETLTYVQVSGAGDAGYDYIIFDDKILFYNQTTNVSNLYIPGENKYIFSGSYNSTLSNLKERIRFVKLQDLEEGTIYHKYVYNEDFSDYTKSLVWVK